MSTKPTKGFLGLAEAFAIFAKYNDTSYVLRTEHDIIYARVNPDELSDNDKKKLKSLGWHKDNDVRRMFIFT